MALSSMFMRGRRSFIEPRPLPSSGPSSSWWCEIARRVQCSRPPLHCMQDHETSPRAKATCSRRDSIAFLIPIACAPVAPCSHIHAAESVHLKEEMKVGKLHRDSRGKRLLSNASLGEVSGFLLASLGELETSTSDLGFLGCLVFGLLFLREKQATAANATSLEDYSQIQLRIDKADTELSSRTRCSISHKLEESQVAVGSKRYISSYNAGQCQLFNMKSSNAEREQKLIANKHILETLEQQVMSVTVAISDVEKHCSTLISNVEQKSNLRQGLEAEVQHMEENIQSTAKAIGKLKVAIEDQERGFDQIIVENIAVESSLNSIKERVVGLKAEFESSKHSVQLSKSSAGVLSKELDIATTRNAHIEVMLKDLLKSLQREGASSAKLLIEQKELLLSSGKRVDECAAELLIQQVELNNKVKTASQLTSEQDMLKEVLKEKTSALENVRETFCLGLETLRILENELPTLLDQLQQERARNVFLQSAYKDDTVSGELLEVTAELEGKVNIEKKLVERLEKELQVSQEALTLIRGEVLELQDRMGSRLSSQVHLTNELTRFNELQQAHGHALKKQKRASAYARKQLMLTRKVLTEESQVTEELQKELEIIGKVIEGSKFQIASLSTQLEAATYTVACLADDVLASKTVHEEQTLKLNSRKNEATPTSSAKPSQRRSSRKLVVPKLRRDSS